MTRPVLRARAVVVAGVVASAIAVTGCRQAPAANPAPLVAQVELAPDAERVAQRQLFLADLHRADSLGRGDVGALADLMTPDVVYLYPGLPVLTGRDSARAVMREAGAQLRVLRWQPIRAEVSASGDFGYTIGYALRETGDSTRLRMDRYQAVWLRREGRWRIAAYSENPAGALPVVRRAPVSLPAAVADDATGSQAADADRAFAADALRIGTGEAFARWAAPDAVLGGQGGELSIGPAAIRRNFGPQPKGATLEWRPVIARGASSGDLAFTVGEAVSTAPGTDGKPVSRQTKYLTVWRRTPDGLRWVTDGGNAR